MACSPNSVPPVAGRGIRGRGKRQTPLATATHPFPAPTHFLARPLMADDGPRGILLRGSGIFRPIRTGNVRSHV
eukprot:scaffold57076_cov66-Phaeocystis_antarctica.AAC.2